MHNHRLLACLVLWNLCLREQFWLSFSNCWSHLYFSLSIFPWDSMSCTFKSAPCASHSRRKWWQGGMHKGLSQIWYIWLVICKIDYVQMVERYWLAMLLLWLLEKQTCEVDSAQTIIANFIRDTPFKGHAAYISSRSESHCAYRELNLCRLEQ